MKIGRIGHISTRWNDFVYTKHLYVVATLLLCNTSYNYRDVSRTDKHRLKIAHDTTPLVTSRRIYL